MIKQLTVLAVNSPSCTVTSSDVVISYTLSQELQWIKNGGSQPSNSAMASVNHQQQQKQQMPSDRFDRIHQLLMYTFAVKYSKIASSPASTIGHIRSIYHDPKSIQLGRQGKMRREGLDKCIWLHVQYSLGSVATSTQCTWPISHGAKLLFLNYMYQYLLSICYNL